MIATNSKTLSAKTQFAKISETQTLAYRSFGDGSPIIFANRFRGTLDDWDPAFLDTIAETNRVVIFQYAGTGSSSGKQSTTHMDLAKEIIALADHLKIDKFAVVGWSFGGMSAQVALTEFPERITHGILIGTRIPGLKSSPVEDIFFEYALKPKNDLNDEIVLFFNPSYLQSKEAAKASHERMALRKEDRVQPMTKEQWENLLKMEGFTQNSYKTFEKMQKTQTPILALMGEHDICFPAEDWFGLKGKLPTTQMLLLPASGHGPQHQYPELAGNYIQRFLASTS